MKTASLKMAIQTVSEADVQKALTAKLSRAVLMVVRINSGAAKTPSGAFFRAYLIHGLLAPTKTGGVAPACSGFPDLLALKGDGNGGIYARLFELKRHGGKRSESQTRFAEFAQSKGVPVEIIEGLGDVEGLVLSQGHENEC